MWPMRSKSSKAYTGAKPCANGREDHILHNNLTRGNGKTIRFNYTSCLRINDTVAGKEGVGKGIRCLTGK